jgi:integrase/recombinase XerD
MQEIKQFLKSKGMTEKTIKTYTSILFDVFNKIGRNFTEQQAEYYLTFKNLSPRSYNLFRAVINFYTKQYLNYQLKFSKSKVPHSLPTYVTKDEINSIIFLTPNIKHKLGLALMYSSGLRSYELVRLKKHDFDFNNYNVRIKEGKGKKDRDTILKISLVTPIKNFMLSLKQDNPYFFQTYRGHISERSFQEVLKRGIARAGIQKNITLHSLRHSFAINCLDSGIDIEDVRRMLGHSSLKTTQIYLQCKTTKLKEIALRLNQNITQCNLH